MTKILTVPQPNKLLSYACNLDYQWASGILEGGTKEVLVALFSQEEWNVYWWSWERRCHGLLSAICGLVSHLLCTSCYGYCPITSRWAYEFCVCSTGAFCECLSVFRSRCFLADSIEGGDWCFLSRCTRASFVRCVMTLVHYQGASLVCFAKRLLGLAPRECSSRGFRGMIS